MDRKSKGDEWRANSLANRMRTLIVGTRDDSLEHVWATIKRENWRRTIDVDAEPIYRSQIGAQLSELANELDVLLSEASYEDGVDESLARRFGTSEWWTLGNEVEVFTPRKIVRGHLIPVAEVPTPTRVSLAVFAFLTIQGERELLHRDNDQFGIHYHYALASKVRTTTMICWDTRWTSDDPTEPKGLKLRPVFHELHGEGTYTKTARPFEWGDKKRKSIREACVPDLRKWDIQPFRCASNNANAVWPINATLTPRPMQVVSTKKKK